MSSAQLCRTRAGDARRDPAIHFADHLSGRRLPPARRDPSVESRALLELARVASRDLPTILQRLAELVVELCEAGSAGVSLLDEDAAGGPVFRWAGVGGAWSPYIGGTMPRYASPCGTVIDRDAVLLVEDVVQLFPAAAGLDPAPVEALLAPFHVAGKPVGTVWAIAHDPRRKFGLEDSEIVGRMAGFAAAAHQGRIADALIAAIADAGDRSAFAQLFEQLTPSLKGHLRGAGCAPQEAEDLVQEAMLAVWRKAPQFDPQRASAKTWIFAIIRNLRVDAFRRGAGARSLQAFEYAGSVAPDHWMEDMPSTDQVERALRVLPAAQMAVIRATYVEHRSHANIAETLHVPLGTVKSRLRLALRRLRTELKPLE